MNTNLTDWMKFLPRNQVRFFKQTITCRAPRCTVVWAFTVGSIGRCAAARGINSRARARPTHGRAIMSRYFTLGVRRCIHLRSFNICLIQGVDSNLRRCVVYFRTIQEFLVSVVLTGGLGLSIIILPFLRQEKDRICLNVINCCT